jgi:hypothetical protein
MYAGEKTGVSIESPLCNQSFAVGNAWKYGSSFE